MKTANFVVLLTLLATGASLAGGAQGTRNPVPNPAMPPACNPAAYVGGVDATGRAVAPADLTPQGSLNVGTVVVPKLRTPNNPNVGNVEVGVELEGLNRAVSPQPCGLQVQPRPEP